MSFSKILYDNRLADATPVASTTAAGYSVLNLRDWKPYTWWKPTALPATVTVDSVATRKADYALIHTHDLHTSQVAVEIRGSTDNFAASDVLLATSNLLAFPQAFDNASWAKTGLTVSANAAVAPDGTVTADFLMEDTSLGEHKIEFAGTVVNGKKYTGTISVKAGGRTWTRVYFPNEGGIALWFNLSTGVFGTVSGTVDSFSSEDLGDGWYELSVTITVTGSSRGFTAAPASADGVSSYTGDGASGIYVWDARLKYGTSPGYYEGISNGPLFLPFTSASYRYWRLRFVQLTGAVMPQIAIASLGEALAVPEGLPNGFDPISRELMGRVNRSGTGIPLGSIVDWEKWQQQARFELITWEWLRNSFLPAWNAHLKHTPFGFAWDPTDHADEIYLVNCDGYQSPHRPGGYCDLSLNLSAAV